ncbi:MAG: Stk1 family PASTA domain-containing Ser/Thr kinase [Lachnospiraceae bacterium]|nr:Stk1 family PASTA domain-containing Ser/Thr kinase [Lachnospiraceae bacterium]
MLRKGLFISDRYEVTDKIGSGGMSDVYKAKDHKLNRFVALKVLKSEFSDDKNFVTKFRVEAQSAACLQHPNIVNVFDVGEDNGIYYIVMELIVGITLKKYIERKKQLPVKEAVSILIQVSQGIEAAHNNHIIHRDIKPQNIIISKEGKVKVTDFGIARAASANTISSNAMGSVHYISPEQAKGGFVDEKSDIYSLGITLYEMLTGHVPFDGDSTVTIALQHVQNEIPSAKEYVPDLPVSVEKIIEKCTQKKPDRRYLKVSSLIADLKHSLIAPDEDFVKIVTGVDETSATRKITDEEVAEIRKKSGFEKPELDIPVINKDNEVIDDDDDDIKDDLEDFDDESNPKLDKIIAIGGIVTAVIILVIVAFLVISIAGNGCSSGKKTGSSGSTALDANHTKVPKLEGLSKQEAIDALKNATLGYVIEQDYDDKVKEGYVISASKEKGDIVKKHTTITLVISRGGKKFDIPDVVGKTKDEAKQILEDKGLKVKIVYEKSDSIPIDQVMKCDPVAPTQVAAGDEITLTVSSGTDATFVKVPNLQGMTETAAKATLDAQKLKLGTVSEEFNDSIQEGKICRQDVEAKSDVTEGSTINVWISKGRDPQVTVPNVVGMSQDAAKAALEQAGLKLGNISQTENTAPAGQVISQTVAANSKANRDTAVDIAVSTGKQETTTPEQKPVQTPKEPEKKQEETTTTPQASSSITISVWDKNSPDKAVQSTNVTAPGSYTFPVDASMNESDITVLVNKKPAKFKYSNGQVVVDVTENDFK